MSREMEGGKGNGTERGKIKEKEMEMEGGKEENKWGGERERE
jgi:hypothetical protein